MRKSGTGLSHSLVARLVVTFLGVSLLMVVVVASIAYRNARDALRDQVVERLRLIADSKERQLLYWLDEQRASVRILATLPDVRPGRAGLGASLRQERDERPGFRALTLRSAPEDRIIASTEAGKTHGQPASPTDAALPFIVSAPVADAAGRTVATLVADLNRVTIDSLFADRSGLGTSGEVYLVDTGHRFVSVPRFARSAEATGARTSGINRAVDDHQNGEATYDDYRGVPVIGVYRWMEALRLGLIAEMDAEEVFAPTRHLLRNINTVGTLTVMLLALLVYLAARRIARPVVNMARTAERVASGDFNAVVPVETHDEVGRLAVAFNEMTIRLRRLYESQSEQVVALERAASALENSGRLLQEVIDNTTAFIMVTDLEDRVLMVNQAFCRLLHADSTALIGRAIAEVFPELDPVRRSSVLAEAASGRVPVVSEEPFTVRGRNHRALVARFVLVDNQDEVYAFCTVATDITEIKRAEEERHQFAEQLQHSQKLESLGILAGGIAHDFNNRLTAILGHANLLLEDLPPDSRSREDVIRILDAALGATEMTSQMLAYAGRGKFVSETVDLNATVSRIADLLRSTTPKRIQFRLELDPGIPRLHADPIQLQQVVMNLLTNATEAIGEEEGMVELRTAAVQATNGDPALAGESAVRLTVADTGPGMDDATLRRIFEPFFTTKFTGRGLGLAAVQGIVRGHSGLLEVETTPGKGSTFSVLLPAGQGTTAPSRPSAVPVAPGHTPTILVVDDEENVRNFLGRALTRAGYRVRSVADGAEALAIYQTNGPEIDAVLLDLTMPGMDGREVLRELRRLHPAVRVVLSSGFSEHDQPVPGSPGQELFLQKPYMLAELLEKIEEVLHRVPSDSGPSKAPR